MTSSLRTPVLSTTAAPPPVDCARYAIQRSQDSRLGIASRLDVLRQLVDGVGAARRKGVVHGDLTPANLFVQHDETLKVLDFGVSRLGDAPASKTAIVGTPGPSSWRRTFGRGSRRRSA